MAYEIPGTNRTYETVGDMSGSQWKFVKPNGALVAAITATTDHAVGVLQNAPGKPGVGAFKPGENNAASVMIAGVTRVKCGAAVAAGVPVTIDAQGRVVTATAGQKIVGITQTAGSAAD